MEPVSRSASDVIVVGTGPGGATVARELSRSGKKVLMLEWGPGGPIRGTFAQYVAQQLVPGKSLLLTRDLLGMVRGITTGGSSLFFYATAFPVPLDMFSAHGIDLADETHEARSELPIGPLKDEMITPMAARLMDSARQLGFAWQKLDKFMYQERWKPEYPFGFYGDPHGVKWSARMYVDEAVENGAVLVNGAKVHRVLVEHGKASGVEFTFDGTTRTATAPVVVLAAGGIGSPIILRRSGIREAGHDFFFDPLITVAGTVRHVKTQHNEIPMSAGVHMASDGYVMTDMAIPPPTHVIFTSQVFKLSKIFAFHSTARIMVKAKDALGGRLTDRGGVRKVLADADREKLMRGFEAAKRILEDAGATDIYKTGYFAAHPGGTVKVGELVDANLQTRWENVYVCDCSVIPEPWGLPPVLTIVALGKRLARHLGAERRYPAGAIDEKAVGMRRAAAGGS